jgi:hypothetical protein
VYVWIRSANTASWATTDSIYTDSISTFTALFGDSVSFYARDSSGTLVTFRNFPANTPGYGNKAFPVLADSVSLTTSNTSDSLKWVGITHFVTNFPLKNGTIAHVWPAARLTINTAGAYTAISVPDPIGVIQPSFMWIKLLATRRSTFSAVGVAAGNRTAGINGLRATATVVYPNR